MTEKNTWIKIDKYELKKLICIRYPGFFTNADKMLITIGGISEINKNIKREKPLELRYRPEDPFCHCIKSSSREVSGCLIRVTKRSSNFVEEIKANLVGIVHKMIIFDRLADFQIVPPRETLESLGSIFDQDIFTPHHGLFVLPSTISKRDIPFDYKKYGKGFDINEIIQTSTTISSSTLNTSKFIGPSSEAGLSFDSEIPALPNFEEMNIEEYEKQRVNQMIKIFKERPILTKKYLQEKFPGYTEYIVKNILKICGYFWKNGPWRQSWTIKGYDPRLDKNSRIYQTIQPWIGRFHDTVDPLKNVGSTQFSYILHSDSPMSHGIFQYCDIDIPNVQEFLSSIVSTSETCSFTDGWYAEGTLQSVRSMIKKEITQTHPENTSDRNSGNNSASIL